MGGPFSPNVTFQKACVANSSNGLPSDGERRKEKFLEYKEMKLEYYGKNVTSCVVYFVEETYGGPWTLATVTTEQRSCLFYAPCPWKFLRRQPGFQLVFNGSRDDEDWQTIARTDVPAASRNASYITCSVGIPKCDIYATFPESNITDPLGTGFTCMEDLFDPDGMNIAVKKTGSGQVACLSTDHRNCDRFLSSCCESMPLKITSEYTKANIAMAPILTCGEEHFAIWGQTGFDVPSHWCQDGAKVLGISSTTSSASGPWSTTAGFATATGKPIPSAASPTGIWMTGSLALVVIPLLLTCVVL